MTSLADEKPRPSTDRDDRTLRTLRLLLGAERAELALTHFASRHVEVIVNQETLRAANGYWATRATLNMLGRFVGVVYLRVLDAITPKMDAALIEMLAVLNRIDSREGKSIRRVDACDARSTGAAARVWIGHATPHATDETVIDPEIDIHVAFDEWTCAVRRGVSSAQTVPSALPFGALAGACFAVAEVFKNLVASAVTHEEAAAFRRRFTNEWQFSTWTMDRIPTDDAGIVSGPDVLPPLSLAAAVQIGGGAVGNATLLTFEATAAVTGVLPVLDPKVVDLKNLNRCFYFTENDLGDPKVQVLARAVGRSELSLDARVDTFSAGLAQDAMILLSTVDNNEVRHRMQETLPRVLVQGATGGTTVSVSVHSPGNGRSCLVCRHPDPNLGVTRDVPLSVSDAAVLTGLTETEIASGRVSGSMAITNEVIAHVAATSEAAALHLLRAKAEGQDLCGALGDLRAQMGTIAGPREASVPFVSNLAGVLAAAEVVKVLLRSAGVPDVPVLQNVIVIDLARNYARHDRLSFSEPPRSDCTLCQDRAEFIENIYARRSQSSSSLL